jgi:hypothetical protein
MSTRGRNRVHILEKKLVSHVPYHGGDVVSNMSGEGKRCSFHKIGRVQCKKSCVNENSSYCAIHQPIFETDDVSERIKCQSCSQMIREEALRQHSFICSKKAKEIPVYYQSGLNDPSNLLLSPNPLTEPLQVDLLDLIPKIHNLYEKYISPMLGPRKFSLEKRVIKPSQKHRLQEFIMSQHMRAYGIIPNTTLPSNLNPNSSPSPLIFLDLGSGKGSLSKTISLEDTESDDSPTLPSAVFVCIEKAHYKHKSERSSSSQVSNGPPRSYRAQIDLRDVCLKKLIRHVCHQTRLDPCNHLETDSGNVSGESEVPFHSSSSSTPSHTEGVVEVIAMGKHLCGNATDSAIVSLLNLLSPPSPEDKEDKEEQRQEEAYPSIALRGICIALCCHSNCQWNSSLCTNWFHSLAVSEAVESEGRRQSTSVSPVVCEEEWEYIRKWSGMFCLNEQEINRDRQGGREGKNDNDRACEDGESCKDIGLRMEYESMSYAERVDLGRKCKRLIDYGRVEFIRKELKMNATLVHYTEEDITPENVLLIAWRD